MKPEKKAEWLAALRSGSFMQGRGQLCEVLYGADDYGVMTEKYCCLGVLANLSGQDFDCEDPFLPEELSEAYEIEEDLQNALAMLNDGSAMDNLITERHAAMTDGEWALIEYVRWRINLYGGLQPPKMSFTEIAEIIEKYL